MAEVRVLVGDLSGTILAEIEPDLGALSWRLNEVGTFSFTIARNDSKATAEILRFGNRVLVEFDNGLPNWGGVIDPPRDWRDNRITVNCYSGEYLLGLRTTDKGRYFSGQDVGYIFSALINEANAVRATGVTVGSVWGGGPSHYPEYHYKSLLEIVRESICDRLSSCEFDVTAVESGGVIRFQANLYERKGADRVGVALVEGENLTPVRLVEQGDIRNAIYLAGAGTNWGVERITSEVSDINSISTYGLREKGEVFADVSVQGTLDGHAANQLAEYKDPHNMLDLEAINLAPGLYQDYDVGDSVSVMMHSVGFGGYSGMVRVMAREYNPSSGTCRLVVRED